MKKIFMMTAILCSTALVSMAGTTKHTTTKARKPNFLVHFVGCGQDTWCYGATWAEAMETAQVVDDAYCTN